MQEILSINELFVTSVGYPKRAAILLIQASEQLHHGEPGIWGQTGEFITARLTLVFQTQRRKATRVFESEDRLAWWLRDAYDAPNPRHKKFL